MLGLLPGVNLLTAARIDEARHGKRRPQRIFEKADLSHPKRRLSFGGVDDRVGSILNDRAGIRHCRDDDDKACDAMRIRKALFVGVGTLQSDQRHHTDCDHHHRIEHQIEHIERNGCPEAHGRAAYDRKDRKRHKRHNPAIALKQIACQKIEEALLPRLQKNLSTAEKCQTIATAEHAHRKGVLHHRLAHIEHSLKRQQNHDCSEAPKTPVSHYLARHAAEKRGAGEEAEKRDVIEVDEDPHETPRPRKKNANGLACRFYNHYGCPLVERGKQLAWHRQRNELERPRIAVVPVQRRLRLSLYDYGYMPKILQL